MNDFSNEFEKAVRVITAAMPEAEKLEKPTLFHSLRVGIYLYSHNYSRAICIAGLLHDAIEDTHLTSQDIEKEFGKEIAEVVDANTKNDSLKGEEKWIQLLEHCVAYGEDALIVKAADILDNHIYYSRIHEVEGINYTTTITSLLFKMKPQEFKDPIFAELENVVTQIS